MEGRVAHDTLHPRKAALPMAKNTYTTTANCEVATGMSNHYAVCTLSAPTTELKKGFTYFAGGKDGSCPEGTTRIQKEECSRLAGKTLDNGVTLSTFGRSDCARHFTPKEGCFTNGKNTYTTTANCEVATGMSSHFAVCTLSAPTTELKKDSPILQAGRMEAAQKGPRASKRRNAAGWQERLWTMV